jgi:hypothetical protein
MAAADNKDELPPATSKGGLPVGPADVNASGKRRWLYGANTAILIIIVLAVVICLDWLSVRFNYRKDLTTGEIYSLSPRTKKLLTIVDHQKKPIYLVNLYPQGQPQGQAGVTEFLQGRKVQQLIKEYTRTSSYVRQFKASKGRKALEEQIRARFKGEFSPYQAAARQFTGLALQIKKFLAAEAAGWGRLAQQPGLTTQQQQVALSVQSVFDGSLPRVIARTQRHAQKALHSTLPDWPRVSKQLAATAKMLASNLAALSKPDALEQTTNVQLGPAITAYLKGRTAAYGKEIALLKSYRHKITTIKPLRAGAILHELTPDSLLVMGPKKLKVLPGYSLFKPRSAGLGQGPQYVFNGEQAVNSALLGMIQKHRTKVVFVSISPTNLISTGGPFSRIAAQLRRSNFKVFQWSPTPVNPQQGPPGPPPAIGQGVIWVVVELPPPGQESYLAGMINKQLEAKVRQHLAQGGNALFLLGSIPEEMMMSFGAKLPFKGLLGGYGIRFRPTYSIVRRTQTSRRGYVAMPEVQVSTFPKTVIGRPLESLATLFAGQMMAPNQFLLAPTVVEPLAHLPPGTMAKVIVQTSAGTDIWGQPSGYTGRAVFQAGTDLPAPLPLAVMAQKGATRVVAIGNVLFASNSILESGQPYVTGGQLGWVYNYPGNAELFVNAMYWLAHDAHLIAVSPRATVALRIARMGSGEETMVRLWSFIGPACLVIVAGFVVFLVRRRV